MVSVVLTEPSYRSTLFREAEDRQAAALRLQRTPGHMGCCSCHLVASTCQRSWSILLTVQASPKMLVSGARAFCLLGLRAPYEPVLPTRNPEPLAVAARAEHTCQEQDSFLPLPPSRAPARAKLCHWSSSQHSLNPSFILLSHPAPQPPRETFLLICNGRVSSS